ncbi:MAG TPA: hypothetical protein VJS43_12245 [Candidatus Acidoferrales bacterium]|nr:hypothetical protein [Candidatus Acidoferrales bacterium]
MTASKMFQQASGSVFHTKPKRTIFTKKTPRARIQDRLKLIPQSSIVLKVGNRYFAVPVARESAQITICRAPVRPAEKNRLWREKRRIKVFVRGKREFGKKSKPIYHRAHINMGRLSEIARR